MIPLISLVSCTFSVNNFDKNYFVFPQGCQKFEKKYVKKAYNCNTSTAVFILSGMTSENLNIHVHKYSNIMYRCVFSINKDLALGDVHSIPAQRKVYFIWSAGSLT